VSLLLFSVIFNKRIETKHFDTNDDSNNFTFTNTTSNSSCANESVSKITYFTNNERDDK